jgi:hypothetical protein
VGFETAVAAIGVAAVPVPAMMALTSERYSICGYRVSATLSAVPWGIERSRANVDEPWLERLVAASWERTENTAVD